MSIGQIQLGIGFRPELALSISRRQDLSFVEILAEDFKHPRHIPQALKDLHKKGVVVIVHSTSLSLGEADGEGRSDRRQRLVKHSRHLNQLASYFDAPFVSDHIAFVRAGNLDSGHLLPVERSAVMLKVLAENIAWTRENLSFPLVLENIAAIFDQPHAQMDEPTFIARVLQESDCGLLLDISNLFANAHNLGFSTADYLDKLPLHRLQYVHVAGGIFKRGLYHDTHCHPLREQSLNLLSTLAERCPLQRVMLERDDNFPSAEELDFELDSILAAARARSAECERPKQIVDPALSSFDIAPTKVEVTSLAERQSQLLRALLQREKPTRDFNAVVIAEAAEALQRKHARVYARSHPGRQ